MKGKIAALAIIAILAWVWVYYGSQTTAVSTNSDSYELLSKEILNQLNEVRRQNHLSPFTENYLLNKAALAHSSDMALNDFFSHTGSDGSDVSDRLFRVGYRYRICAENIIMKDDLGFSGFIVIWFIPIPIPNLPKNDVDLAKELVNSWMNSPGHKANILNPALREVGIGIASSGKKLYVTTDFGTRM
ncbi:MAG: CAP domain-containing protein [Candidatus Methanomethylicaceae archaeon]